MEGGIQKILIILCIYKKVNFFSLISSTSTRCSPVLNCLNLLLLLNIHSFIFIIILPLIVLFHIIIRLFLLISYSLTSGKIIISLHWPCKSSPIRSWNSCIHLWKQESQYSLPILPIQIVQIYLIWIVLPLLLLRSSMKTITRHRPSSYLLMLRYPR